jgi:hypothetical protein
MDKFYIRYLDTYGVCSLDDNSFDTEQEATAHAEFIATWPTVCRVELVKATPVKLIADRPRRWQQELAR